MKKLEMREWVASLGEVIDNKLKLWKRENPIENGESVHLCWQFEQTRMKLYIFWEDGAETVEINCSGPRVKNVYLCHGLTNKTFNKVTDRIGNWAQMVMHPALDVE